MSSCSGRSRVLRRCIELNIEIHSGIFDVIGVHSSSQSYHTKRASVWSTNVFEIMSTYSSSQRGPVHPPNVPYSTAPAQHCLRHSQQVSSAYVVSSGHGYAYYVPVIYGPMSPDAYHAQHQQFAAQLPHGAHGHHSSKPLNFNEPNGTKSQSREWTYALLPTTSVDHLFRLQPTCTRRQAA